MKKGTEPTYEILKVVDPMHLVVEETIDLGPKRPADMRCYVETVDAILANPKYHKAWEEFVK